MKIRHEVVEVILLEHARRDEDQPGPSDLPRRALQRPERRHAWMG